MLINKSHKHIKAEGISFDDFQLQELLTPDQLVERHALFTKVELLAAMRAGKLRHWPNGRKRFTTEKWLQDYIRSQLRGGSFEAAQKDSGASQTDLERSRRSTPAAVEEEFIADILIRNLLKKPRGKSQRHG